MDLFSLFSWIFLLLFYFLPFSFSLPLFLLPCPHSTFSSAQLSFPTLGISSSTTSLRNSWAMRASSQGDRSADGPLSRGGGALDDASRRTSGGGHGRCLGGGDRSESVSQRETRGFPGLLSARAITPVLANASMAKPPRAMRICARCWLRLSGALVIPRTTPSRRSHTA